MRVDNSKWKIRRLSEIAYITMGQSPESSSYNKEAFGLPFYQGNADFGKKHPTPRIYCNAPTRTAKEHELLISVRAPIGAINITVEPCCIGRGLAAIKMIDGISYLHFMKYVLKAANYELNRQGTGMTFKAINKKVLHNLVIHLPTFDVQQAIASELDAVQEMIDGYKAQLEDLDALAQSIFLDTFGDPVSNPKGWGKKTLNEICSKITDGTHDTPKRLTEGIKFITGKNIRPFFIDYDHSDYVSENVHKEIYARCNPQKGDVLYTNIGSGVGTAAVNTVNYEFSMKNVALLKPSKELNGIYLQFVLNDIHFKSVVLPTYLAGGAQSFLSLKQIKSMLIPLPNFVHQQQFAEQVEAIEKQKDLLREQLKDAETLMAERMQYYFS